MRRREDAEERRQLRAELVAQVGALQVTTQRLFDLVADLYAEEDEDDDDGD